MEYTTRKNITIAQDSYFVSLPAKVTNTGITAVNGKKILKAGTPIAGDIKDRDTAFKKATTTGASGSEVSDAVGVLLHDVDVTAGAANGVLVLAGVIDMLKLETDVQALVTSFAEAAMPRIIYVKGSAI